MNAKTSGLKKIMRIFLWTGTSLLFLLLSGLFFLSRYVPNVLRDKINHIVVNGSDSLYKCSMGKISVNFFQGKVSIEDLHITVDSVKYHQQKLAGKLPNLTFELKMQKGSISNLQIFSLLFSKKIRIGTIEVNKANIALCRQFKEKKKPTPSEASLWKMLKPAIRGIYIDKVLLNGTKFVYRQSENKKDVALAYQDCSVRLEHIRIDSIGAANSSRILFTEEIAVQLVGLNYVTPDSLYNLRIDSLSYSSFCKRVKFTNVDFKPTMSPVELTKKHGMQLDIFELLIPEMTGYNFKIDRVFTDNEICFDTIRVKKPIIRINRDRAAPSDTTSQMGKYPNEALLSAPFKLRIPLVEIEEAEMHYVERQKLSLKTGDLYFTKVTGTITNITNHPDDIAINNHCKFNLNGFFLKTGRLHVTVDFDLASPTGNYNSTADWGPISANELNKVFIPFGNVQLKTLELHEGHIKFNGNSNGLHGSARLIYEKLSILILKVDPGTHQTKKQGLISFFANVVAVREHNKAGKNEVIADDIHIIRKGRQPFGNILWEFLFEGLKGIILKIPAKNMKAEM
jgi:hypothetical protein